MVITTHRSIPNTADFRINLILEFTSEECKYINTGPVLRAWDPADPLDLKKRDFEFADETFKNTLEVCANISS